MSNLDEFLDVAETARRLGVSVSYLNKARCTGGGPKYVKMSKAVRYRWREVMAWAESRTHRSTSERGEAA
jgi:predicted DNA-binding transcriptional regulator AlpA